ncbi:hypothetical protein D3C73_880450 [compost metagenome]
MDRRPARQRRVVRERQGVDAQLHHPLHLGHSRLHVPERCQHQRNEATRRRPRPVEAVPVVVGPDGRQSDLGILPRRRLETRTCKPRERRKAERPQNAVGVHVLHPRLDVPRPSAHLLVVERLHPVFFLGTAHHRVQPHVARSLLLKHPDVAPVYLLDLRLAPLQVRRPVRRERTRRLNHVIVHAHKDHIIDSHAHSSAIGRCRSVRKSSNDSVIDFRISFYMKNEPRVHAYNYATT